LGGKICRLINGLWAPGGYAVVQILVKQGMSGRFRRLNDDHAVVIELLRRHPVLPQLAEHLIRNDLDLVVLADVELPLAIQFAIENVVNAHNFLLELNKAGEYLFVIAAHRDESVRPNRFGRHVVTKGSYELPTGSQVVCDLLQQRSDCLGIRKMTKRIAHADNQFDRSIDVGIEVQDVITHGAHRQVAGTLPKFCQQVLTKIDSENIEAPFGQRNGLAARAAAQVDRQAIGASFYMQALEQRNVPGIGRVKISQDP
jgi:hypothetical protein